MARRTRVLGRRSRPHRGAAQHAPTSRSTHLARRPEYLSTWSARRKRRRTPTPRRSPTRSRGSCRDCSALSTSTPIRCRAASTSCCRTSSPRRGPLAATSTSPTLVGQVQQPPVRKLGVFEVDTFFPPKDRTELALRLNGLLASPSFAAWTRRRAVRHRPPADVAEREARRCDRHDRAPVRSRAAVRHFAAAREARHVDASSERHHRPPCASVHGRGRGLRAAHG